MPSWIIGAYAIASGAVLVHKWLTDRNRSLRSDIKRVPVTPIAELIEGEAMRVTGVLRYAGTPLQSPISKRPCAAWHVLVWQLRGERRKSWELVDDAQQSQPFYLDAEPGSGSVRVEGAWLDLLLHPDRQAENSVLSHVPPEFEAYLRQREMLVHSFSWGKNAYRIHEGILEESERVTVVGKCSRKPIAGKPGEGYRDVPMEMTLGPLDDDRLLASDEARLTTT